MGSKAYIMVSLRKHLEFEEKHNELGVIVVSFRRNTSICFVEYIRFYMMVTKETHMMGLWNIFSFLRNMMLF